MYHWVLRVSQLPRYSYNKKVLSGRINEREDTVPC
uniref:Uncharacterized protein n=1 Tax=Siphoviridae sp. ct7FW4 TaxID=2826303 RepID=A0A8S5MB46_9CAUD|nr:MAG TPA: hypothetical protein [Siphoviridae sp. ct7FW4]